MNGDLNFSELKSVFYAIICTNEIHGISIFIRKKSADILVMKTHKNNFLERLFGMAHTKEMSYHTEIPLLVFHGY